MNPKEALETQWMHDWSVKLRIWFERQGRAVLGPGRAELLAEIDRLRSISGAARELGMSYRHAWVLVQQVNEAAGEPLVESAVGGRKGGGARLTERGRLAMRLFQRLQAEISGAAAQALPRAMRLPTDGPTVVHVAAAISTQAAVNQSLTEFALSKPTITARSIFGASNELAEHILAGAPIDLFITADADQLDLLDRAGHVVSNTRRNLGANRLVIVSADERTPWTSSRALKSITSTPIAMAIPSCPLGKFTAAWLSSVHREPVVLKNAIVLDNSRAVLDAVRSRSAELGIVYWSDAAQSDDLFVVYNPTGRAAECDYFGAVLNRGWQQNAAEDLLQFMATAAGQRCFKRQHISPNSKRSGARRRDRHDISADA